MSRSLQGTEEVKRVPGRNIHLTKDGRVSWGGEGGRDVGVFCWGLEV